MPTRSPAGGEPWTSFSVIRDPEVVRFTGGPGTEFTLEHLRSWYGSRSAQPDRLDLAVTDRATGELVGEVVLYEWDARALRAYEKAGFVREGVRREADLRDGRWVDWVLMAVLEQEWAALSPTAR
ncbi:GNAT family N-acetyltransferase [Streptomyces sp. NPDC051913]|uniref:GNAT family N-acetyltransferase n=1 Tax=Streptomyces sp. NPDC051913 TaxID=3365676 RepID=UPI0037CEF5F1